MTDAHAIGAVALVEVGCSLWSTKRRDARFEQPIGGVVVDTITEALVEDGEPTGEYRRLFEVIDPTEPILEKAFHRLAEDEVDLAAMDRPYEATLRKLICRLDAAVAARKGRTFESRDARYQALAGRLMSAIFGGNL